MQTITLETNISQDGSLNISIPSGLPPGKVEIVLVIQPKTVLGAVGSYKEPTEAGAKGINDAPVYANSSGQSSAATQKEQGKRMMELLTIALKGVEWKEIEEGRADDENRY